SITAARHDVAAGYTGYFQEHPTMEIPPALHEKDLLVVDLDPGWTPKPPEEAMPLGHVGSSPAVAEHAREPRLLGGPLAGFAESLKRGCVIVCLLEGEVAPPAVGAGPVRGGSFAWLPTARATGHAIGRAGSVTTIDVASDNYLHVPEPVVEELPELAR